MKMKGVWRSVDLESGLSDEEGHDFGDRAAVIFIPHMYMLSMTI